MLVTIDLILSTTCVPKTLSIFWFGPQAISFPCCLTQLFFLHYSFVLDSAILLAMAFDRYMAICSPLRYTTILIPKTIVKIALGICFQSFCVFVPCVFLVNHLPFCMTHIISHTYCEHRGVAQLSCADISINIWYGCCVPIMTVMTDVILIAVSYTLILCAVFCLPSRDSQQKALGTCGSHVCVILIFYIPAFFSILAHCFGHNVPRNFHIVFANLYVIILLSTLLSMDPFKQNPIKNHTAGRVWWLTPVIPALWEAEAGGSSEKFETNLANIVKSISTKNTKISQVSWYVPVIPATLEAEAGESLEPGMQRVQEVKIDLRFVPSASAVIIFNLSSYNPGPFILGSQAWSNSTCGLGFFFCITYTVAVVGNCILLYLIAVEHSLHEPMFFFLSMLAMTDLILSTAGVPEMLSIFWLGTREITFPGCLTQMFFLHYSFVLDSAILMAMAFDRYVAICSPLRYTTILTPKTIIKVAMSISFRSFYIILPDIFLLTCLPFCRTRFIPHTYCEHIGVAWLACADIYINIWYGFCVPIMTVISDVILIAVSYTLILCAVFRLPFQDAHQKALGTCGSHVCVILMFYTPAFFSILAHRFGHNVSRSFHIMFANLYIVIPPALNPIVYGVKTKQMRDKANCTLKSSCQSDLADLWIWALCPAGGAGTGSSACLALCACVPALHGSFGRECPSPGLVVADKALLAPMYQLLELLAAANFVLATSTVPKALAVLWGLSSEISFGACLAQLFAAHVASIAESSVLLARL
ncbi:LOW QUALITY PROTEIN: Olfactory receptor 52H1 [Plecturocebus cupreus]